MFINLNLVIFLLMLIVFLTGLILSFYSSYNK